MSDLPTRREAIGRATLAAGTVLAGLDSVSAADAGEVKRKFTKDLVGGAIGVNASPEELIELAAKHGFESTHHGMKLDLSQGCLS